MVRLHAQNNNNYIIEHYNIIELFILTDNYDIVDGTRADNCLERMVKAGLLGVQLLPRGAMKGSIIIIIIIICN